MCYYNYFIMKRILLLSIFTITISLFNNGIASPEGPKNYLKGKFYQSVKIDLDEIKRNLIKNDKQTEYNLSEIVFGLEKNENLDDKFQMIKTEIDKNSFKNAALIYSISDTSVSGGNLGWIKQSSINQKILKEILKVQVNQPTNPIRIPSGFLILNINELRETKKGYRKNDETKRKGYI